MLLRTCRPQVGPTRLLNSGQAHSSVSYSQICFPSIAAGPQNRGDDTIANRGTLKILNVWLSSGEAWTNHPVWQVAVSASLIRTRVYPLST